MAKSSICLTAKMITFRFEDEIWLLFFSAYLQKIGTRKATYIYFLLTRKVSTVIFTIAR